VSAVGSPGVRSRITLWLGEEYDFSGLVLARWVPASALAVLAVVAVISLVQDTSAWRVAAAAAMVGPQVVLVLRPRSPGWVGLALSTIGAAALIGGNSAAIGLLGVLCLAAEAGLLARRSAGLVVVLLGGGFLFTHGVIDMIDHANTGWYLSGTGTVITWAGGRLARSQQQTVVAVRQAREELASAAVTAERQRIARDVHDLVAHSLTVTMLHLTAARLALEDDIEAARTALLDAEAVARAGMAEIRHTIGLLPRGAQPLGSPLPGASDLCQLVESYRRAGLQVDFRMDGPTISVPPAAGLTLYRIVQESLANVVKHAPGQAATVEVVMASGRVELRVVNPLAAVDGGARRDRPDTGQGVVGMRERAGLAGGVLSAGRGPGPSWTVAATLPTRAEGP
jgi:signal transduction histidine kinase